MLANTLVAVQAVHSGLLIAGLTALGSFIVYLSRHGRWRNPLSGVPLPADGPNLAGPGVVIVVYVLAQLVFASVALPRTTGTMPAIGSDAWHRMQTIDAAARTTAVLVMGSMPVLAWPRSRRDSRRMGLGHFLALSVFALLVILPLIEVQLQMGTILWQWLHPDAPPPMHDVLDALRASEWGGAGRLQLFVSAVLIAPVSEELFFRGVLLQSVCHHTRHGWFAIIISALAFGLVHAQPQDVLPLVTMGVALGYVRLAAGSVWPCVAAHALFNARTMIFALLAPEILG